MLDRGLDLWNQLPENIQKEPNKSKFKEKVKIQGYNLISICLFKYVITYRLLSKTLIMRNYFVKICVDPCVSTYTSSGYYTIVLYMISL